MSEPITVLVIDDSAVNRRAITQMLESGDDVKVLDRASDGEEGLKKVAALQPDVITLDLEMPRLDGFAFLRLLMARTPTPVIVVSSHSTEGASITLRALSLGAFDFVAKPTDVSSRMQESARELIAKIKAAAQSRGIQIAGPGEIPMPAPRPKMKAGDKRQPSRIVAIGISTGGPQSLQYLLAQLPHDFPGSIVVVQHMPEGFTEMFARRLDECCALNVKEAQSGDLLLAGRVLICPGSRHLKVKRLPLGDVAVLSEEARVNGHRPSADVLFKSVAEEFGSRGVGVIMTGMGDDGAHGLGLIKVGGGMTIAQSERSCVVFGMPKAAIERGHAMRIVDLKQMASTLRASHSGS